LRRPAGVGSRRGFCAGTVIGRIVRSVDFERVLAASSRARSPHFAVHHVSGVPSLPRRPSNHRLSTELSTAPGVAAPLAVDDPSPDPPGRLWIGAVIPKRHAKRSVTRTLLKRQIRAAVERQPHLPPGLWVVRLRAPFPRTEFVSAASDALRRVAHDELDALLASAALRGA
jgi:ribonuclease P protein component